MGWLEDNNRTSNENTDSIWLKFPSLENVGDKAEVRMRILQVEPVGVWQHWLEGRPFNCPNRDCPVCLRRNEAKLADPDKYRIDWPMRYRYFINTLVEGPVVKVFAFSQGLGRDLRSVSEKYESRYGPLTAYDITVRRTKTGRLPMNVEYSVFFEDYRELTAEEKAASRELIDLAEFIKPATHEDLVSVANGRMPAREGDERARLIGEIRRAIPADLDLSHFIDPHQPPTTAELENVLQTLTGK